MSKTLSDPVPLLECECLTVIRSNVNEIQMHCSISGHIILYLHGVWSNPSLSEPEAGKKLIKYMRIRKELVLALYIIVISLVWHVQYKVTLSLGFFSVSHLHFTNWMLYQSLIYFLPGMLFLWEEWSVAGISKMRL